MLQTPNELKLKIDSSITRKHNMVSTCHSNGVISVINQTCYQNVGHVAALCRS